MKLQNEKDTDAYVIISSLPSGLTVAIQHKDGECCTPDTVIGHGSDDHSVSSNKARVMNTG